MMPKLNINLPASFFKREDKVLTIELETKRLWAVELDLLSELRRVCDKYNIKFFAISGTLIGAARHRGFIPWDDDIDVVMLRSEYQKLERVASSDFKHPYFLQTNRTDPGSARGHAQLRHSGTTAILKSEMERGRPIYQFNQGVFLDIFPLDALPDDLTERTVFLNTISRLKGKVWLARCRRMWRTGRRGLVGAAWQWFVEKFFCQDVVSTAYEKLEAASQKYNNIPCKQCAPIMFSPSVRKHELFDLSDFQETIELPFETMSIPCPIHYVRLLERAFGDWHKHVIGASSHGGMFIDLDHPYTDYLKK